MFKEFDSKVNEILAKLSLKEKIGQLNQVKVPSGEEETARVKELIRNGSVGSIILASCATAGNDDKTKMRLDFFNDLQKTAIEESKSGIPIIFGRDVIHGHHTVYPIPLASAAAFNDELVEHCYKNIAWEATADGINWTFSPMLDMSRDPRWGRMVEGPGEDPYVGARLARACVKGFQGDDLTDKYSLAAGAKHYIGDGASEGGRDYHRTEISDYSLYNDYLPAVR
ncbi:MAG: beta-glucosidase, partial [Clostridia bacterium]|nr:beta-glucosidase [Clostridia bacterium]